MKRFILLLVTFVLPYALNSHYQDEKFFSVWIDPEVVIIFDVSGSMTYDINGCNTWGDGVRGVGGRDMDGDGLPNDSRMHITKEALHQVVPEFQFRWGLFKFLQYARPHATGQRDQYLDLRPDCDNDSDSLYPPVSYCSDDGMDYDNDYCSDYEVEYGNNRDFHGDLVEIGYASETGTYAVEALQTVVVPAEGSPSHINLIQSWIDNDLGSPQELAARGGTPIAGALRGARYEYFMDEIPGDPAKECRGYFVILVTDGEPTYGIDSTTYNKGAKARWAGDGGTVETLWQKQSWWEADSLRHIYIEPGLTADVRTYVIGVGIASATLDSIAKYGGTDNSNSSHYYYPAYSPEDIVEAFRNISADIYRRAASFSSGEVTSIEEEFLSSEYEARMYLASFYPSGSPFWEGHLRAMKLPTGGNIAMSLDSVPDDLVIWNAGELLRERNPATRNIYGASGGSLLAFDTTNFDATDLNVSSMADADTVVNLVRSGRKVLDSTRSYLGDIFHSAPLRIGSPNYFYHDDDFYKFRDSINNIRQRPTLIYAGGNTGMLHAFLDTNGAELFSVIPENFVPQVKDLRDTHRFYVDADPVASDVWFPSEDADSFKNMNEWKTILWAAQGEGGRGITVLDVTDPDYPLHAFSFYEDTMALTTSVTTISKVERIVGSDTVERFFALFGGGEWPDSLYDIYDPTSTGTLKGNVIVAVDIYDAVTNGLSLGSNFWYIPAASGDEDKMVYPFAAAGNVVNVNPQEGNLYDFFYIPDLAGQLWKVDTRDPDVSSWSARCIFQPIIAKNSGQAQFWQPAFYRPHIERDPSLGCLWLFYGTGDRSRVFKSPTENRFYAIMDTLVGAETYPIREEDGDLLKISPSGSFNPASDFPTYKGWYAVYSDYGHEDEKTVGYAGMYMDTVKVVTFSPEETGDPCVPLGGVAREYFFQFRTGTLGKTRFLGTGIPQAPRYSFDLEGGGVEIIQTSDSLWIEQKTGSGSLKRIMKWKER